MRLFPILILAACQSTAPAPPPPAPPAGPVEAGAGMRTLDSANDVAVTVERLAATASQRGLIVFSVIDHAANATNVGVELPPTQMVLLGKPEVGSKLMACGTSIGLDLPQRFLVTEQGGKTRISWNDPAWLAQRHGLTDCDPVVEKVAGVLEGLAKTAGEAAPATPEPAGAPE